MDYVAGFISPSRQMSPFFNEDKVARFMQRGEHRRTFAGTEFVGVLNEQVRRKHDLDDVRH
jgi:hypothetical protein